MGDFHCPHITMIIIHKTDFVKYERIIDMKKFASLTELEVLNLAYDSILRMWNEAKESNEDCKKDLGYSNPIFEYRIVRYRIKMEELRSEILSLEKKRKQVNFNACAEMYRQIS